jgi:hypothetical protein
LESQACEHTGADDVRNYNSAGSKKADRARLSLQIWLRQFGGFCHLAHDNYICATE